MATITQFLRLLTFPLTLQGGVLGPSTWRVLSHITQSPGVAQWCSQVLTGPRGPFMLTLFVFGLLITASYLVSHFRFPASQHTNQFFLSLTVRLLFPSVMFLIYLFIQCSFTGFTWAGLNSLGHPFNRSPFSAEAPYGVWVSPRPRDSPPWGKLSPESSRDLTRGTANALCNCRPNPTREQSSNLKGEGLEELC